MNYSYPLIIVGFGGMINEMLSRLIYRKILHDDPIQEERELGIFGANFKLAVLITIFIQIFKLAAEPFFFNQSGREDAKKIYARVMKFFVIACCFMFLIVSLFLRSLATIDCSQSSRRMQKEFILFLYLLWAVFSSAFIITYRSGISSPIRICLARISRLPVPQLQYCSTLSWIPPFRYTGAAWATLICYAFMMVVNYHQGQKYYPIPYAKKNYLPISRSRYLYISFMKSVCGH